MSKLNDIQSSYGKSFSIATANTYSYVVENIVDLPKNMIIISSPDDEQHSILVTDNYGVASRLTYEINTGNGLNDHNGTLSLDIDTSMFKDKEGNLSIDFSEKIDNSTITLNNDKLVVSTKNIKKASKTTYGTVKVDNSTIVSDNGILTANTTNLDLSNDNTNTFGIIKSSENITANNGILSVNTQSLNKATNSSYGIIKTDDTLVINNGVISLNINSFGVASDASYGLSIPDNNSIYKTQENVLKINYNALKKTSYNTYGLIKPDNVSTEVENGVLKVKNYSNIQQTIINLNNDIISLNNRIDNIGNELQIITPSISGSKIFTFVCDGLSSIDLVKPSEYGEVPEKMPMQKVSATFIINTNCPFKININYIDNISPAVSLFELNYNDVDKYPGITGLTRTYQSTNEKDVKITLSWLCKNYRKNENTEYSTKTRIHITAFCANDVSIFKEVKYSIVRFNSLYNDDLINGGNNDDTIIEDQNNIIIPTLGLNLVISNLLNNGITYNDVQYTVSANNSYLYPLIYTYNTTTGKIKLEENRSYMMYTPQIVIPTLDLYLYTESNDGENGENIYYSTLTRNDLDNIKITSYFVNGTIQTQVKDITLELNSDNAIILSYKGNF